ncbi:MAG: leucine-rich repeat domain-containing protein [Eubacteriales bacterium]
MKHNGLIFFIIILLLVLTLPMTVFAETEEPAKIADVAFKDVIRGMLNKGVYDDVYPSELAEFTGEMDFSDLGITDLRGLEYFVNVESFNFSNNEIDTLPSNMAVMENLKSLDLSFNNMYALPPEIADAPNLDTLILAGNKLKILPTRIQEMGNLRNLDISGNRFEELQRRLIYLHLDTFNCNYNFIDLSEGTISRKNLDNMDISGQPDAYKQLIKLPKITYATESGNFVIKWRSVYDVPFYDGTSAEVVGYTILLDGVFQETVDADVTELDLGYLGGGTYEIAVSPDYKVDGFGEFPLRYYTTLSAQFGKDGPYIPDNPEPEVFENPGGTTTTAADVSTGNVMVETDTDTNDSSGLDQMSAVTWILIAVVVLLALGLGTMLVLFLRKKTDAEKPAPKKKK